MVAKSKLLALLAKHGILVSWSSKSVSRTRRLIETNLARERFHQICRTCGRRAFTGKCEERKVWAVVMLTSQHPPSPDRHNSVFHHDTALIAGTSSSSRHWATRQFILRIDDNLIEANNIMHDLMKTLKGCIIVSGTRFMCWSFH